MRLFQLLLASEVRTLTTAQHFPLLPGKQPSGDRTALGAGTSVRLTAGHQAVPKSLTLFATCMVQTCSVNCLAGIDLVAHGISRTAWRQHSVVRPCTIHTRAGSALLLVKASLDPPGGSLVQGSSTSLSGLQHHIRAGKRPGSDQPNGSGLFSR